MFDVDGVLVDSLKRSFKLEQEVVHALGGRVPSFEEFRGSSHRGSWKEYYAQFGVDSEQALDLFYKRLTYESLTSVPGVIETLEELEKIRLKRESRKGRLKFGIASLARSPDRVRKKLEIARLAKYCSDSNVYTAKQDKSVVIRQELKVYSIEPRNEVIVTDTGMT